METTRLSTKGQIVLPKDIRTARAWGPGTKFTVEERGDGILLRPSELFPETGLDQVVSVRGERIWMGLNAHHSFEASRMQPQGHASTTGKQINASRFHQRGVACPHNIRRR